MAHILTFNLKALCASNPFDACERQPYMSFDELANGIGALDLPPETAMDFARVGISATGSALSLAVSFR